MKNLDLPAKPNRNTRKKQGGWQAQEWLGTVRLADGFAMTGNKGKSIVAWVCLPTSRAS